MTDDEMRARARGKMSRAELYAEIDRLESELALVPEKLLVQNVAAHAAGHAEGVKEERERAAKYHDNMVAHYADYNKRYPDEHQTTDIRLAAHESSAAAIRGQP